MHDDALKELWRSQSIQAPPLPNQDQLAAMKCKLRSLDRTLFWRDCREAFAALIVVGFFGAYFFIFTTPLARLGSILVILSSVFVVAYPISRKRGVPRPAPDATLMESLHLELRRVEVEIALLRSVHWWYILPGTIGVLIFLAGLLGSTGFAIVIALFGIAFDALIYWINQVACDKGLLPVKHEIESLMRVEGTTATPEAKRSYTGAKIAMLLFTVLGIIMLVAGVHEEEKLRPPAFSDVSAFTAGDRSRIDEWLRQQVIHANYPSLNVAIVRDGRIVYQRSYGFEDINTTNIASAQTSYNVASVTKAFTATLAVILHERGVVDLNAPVTKYLPNDVVISTKAKSGATITLRQLASHTSGLQRGVPGPVQSIEDRYQLEPERLYVQLAKAKLEFEPGTAELYSNLGFGLLGHALERAAGKPFEQLLQETVCEPLKLERTAIHVHDKLRVARGYGSNRRRVPEEHSYRERLAASGGLVASVEDLARFLSAQMAEGVLNRKMLDLLHTPTKLANGSNARTALGWSIATNRLAGRIIHKNGGRNNCSAWIGFAPDHKIGVAVVTNCGEPSVDPIGLWLLERAIAR
jgi:CubicO group peptidase (beta-lactamase class C family)